MLPLLGPTAIVPRVSEFSSNCLPFVWGKKIKERGKKEKMRKVHGINNITDITSGRNFGKREMHFFLISVLRTVTIRSMAIQ